MIFSPTLANGQQVFVITGGMQGLSQITYACTSYPSAGTITLEYQVAGSSAWVLATGTTGETSTQPATAQANWELFGATSQLRITFASLSGGSGCLLAATAVQPRGHPYGVYQGLRAITVQEYTEANVKRGTQFELSVFQATVAAAANVDFLFTTGALPVVIKSRSISTTATQAEFHVYKSPTATNGASIPVYNLNTNPAIAVASTVSIHAAATVSAVGTETAAPTYIVGSTGQGQTIYGTYAASGIERLLVPNTTFLARFTNTGTASCAASVLVSWYEGQTDLPLS